MIIKFAHSARSPWRWLILGLSMACVSLSAWCTSWWEDDIWTNPDRGFNWYPPDEVDVSPQKPEPPKAAPRPDISQLKSVEAINKEWKRLRDLAILTPTPANMHEYLKANQFVLARAGLYADVARRATWQFPDVDYNAKSPAANFAQTEMKDLRYAKANQVMDTLAKTHGLLFFFRSDCPYCHMQAPILQMLKRRYGIEVLGVTLDGKGIKEFPEARPDNGIADFVSGGRGVDIVPAVYLVSKDRKQVEALGTGVLAMDEIVDRINVLTTTKPGEEF